MRNTPSAFGATLVATALLLAGVTAIAAQGSPTMEHLVFNIDGHGNMPYAVSVPDGYDPDGEPRPLVLALHPGGITGAYYGSRNLRGIFEPGLRGLGAVMVAPDVPTRRWNSDVANRGVMALLQQVVDTYNIDRSRILVTGFSLGGAGTWFFAGQHPDFFTGAIPIAGRASDLDPEAFGDMPIHIIHSRADEVVPFEPAEAAFDQLEAAGHPVAFTPLEGVGHFNMGSYVPSLQAAGDWMVARWDGR
ncbi:MAG: prolyl oligopeptidase family serine peptidase [Acidobacteria bacterium]|nr:prolyl oligopeptidase family serine peptidase [Acidobacteriota bacterium]MYJ04794.1 prolyl oligopeptidase family serine peptidase [Acidobacteriota bacterium]